MTTFLLSYVKNVCNPQVIEGVWYDMTQCRDREHFRIS